MQLIHHPGAPDPSRDRPSWRDAEAFEPGWWTTNLIQAGLWWAIWCALSKITGFSL